MENRNKNKNHISQEMILAEYWIASANDAFLRNDLCSEQHYYVCEDTLSIEWDRMGNLSHRIQMTSKNVKDKIHGALN